MGYRAEPNMGQKYAQGKYNLINPSKYLGDPTSIFFRSSWEYKLYFHLDNDQNVQKWNVEGITIPYEIMENNHWTTNRYFPDCYAEIKKPDGSIRKVVLEIKPYAETQVPDQPKKNTLKALENYEYRMRMYIKNLNKWKAAKEYCDKRGFEFHLLTERYFKDNDLIKIF